MRTHAVSVLALLVLPIVACAEEEAPETSPTTSEVVDGENLAPTGSVTSTGLSVALAGSAGSPSRPSHVLLPVGPVAGSAGAAGAAGSISGLYRGALANGVASTTFVIDAAGQALTFTVPSAGITAVTEGFAYKGSLVLDTPGGPLTLAGADIVFQGSAANAIDTIVGTVEVPAPSTGALSGFASASGGPRATFGYALGSELKARGVEAPMLDGRKYIALDYSVGPSVSAGPVTLSAPGAQSGTLVIDPSDPSFYMTGDLIGLSSVGPFSGLGLGLSSRGLLPFTPNVTWGIEDQIKPLTGHIYSKGTVDLTRLPLSIDGEMVVNIDPSGKGRRLGEGEPEGVALGMNGTVNAFFDINGWLSFRLPLAHASLGARTSATESYGYLSGDIAPEISWIPAATPFVPASALRVAGYIDGDKTRSHFAAEGTYGFKVNKLTDLVPTMPKFPMGDCTIASATLSADKDGLKVAGTTTQSLFTSLPLKGTTGFSATFPADPQSFGIALTGDIDIATFPLASGSIALDKAGATIKGSFVTPLSSIEMLGNASLTGASFSGKVHVNLKGLRQVTETVTDGATCGYQTTASGARCGYSTVVDANRCGTSYVRNAGYCGSETVTNAALCGTRTVTDGAICGYNVITSCFLHPSKCGKKAKSCSVANTCNVARQCNVPNTCSVENSCADLSKPKSCTKVSQVSGASFGTYDGTISVETKADGTVGSKTSTGKQCEDVPVPLLPDAHVCTPKADVSVELGAKPRLCMSVSGAIGAVCGDF